MIFDLYLKAGSWFAHDLVYFHPLGIIDLSYGLETGFSTKFVVWDPEPWRIIGYQTTCGETWFASVCYLDGYELPCPALPRFELPAP